MIRGERGEEVVDPGHVQRGSSVMGETVPGES